MSGLLLTAAAMKRRPPAAARAGMILLFKNLVFTVLVPGTVAFYVPITLAGGGQALRGMARTWHAWVAALPLIAGTCIYLRCVWDFATVGRGTPAPVDSPKHLVVAGLYRYVRNPMYVGVLLVITGWAVFFWSRRVTFYACGAALAFHMLVVLLEEPLLSWRFGASYQAYRRAVRRWIPGKPYEDQAAADDRG